MKPSGVKLAAILVIVQVLTWSHTASAQDPVDCRYQALRDQCIGLGCLGDTWRQQGFNSLVACTQNCQRVAWRELRGCCSADLLRQDCIETSCNYGLWQSGGFSSEMHCAENCRVASVEQLPACRNELRRMSVKARPKAPPMARPAAQSCEALWRARNTLFHRYGYCFKGQKGKRVFGNRGCSRNGVQARAAMSPQERRQVDLIKTKEKQKGC